MVVCNWVIGATSSASGSSTLSKECTRRGCTGFLTRAPSKAECCKFLLAPDELVAQKHLAGTPVAPQDLKTEGSLKAIVFEASAVARSRSSPRGKINSHLLELGLEPLAELRLGELRAERA